MPLSNDQKALLRLLAQREEGYEDIGALMGIDVDEVRARVRGALAELDSRTEPAPRARPGAAAVEASAPVAPSTTPRAAEQPSTGADEPASPPAGRRTAPSRPSWLPRLPQSPQQRRQLALGGGALALIAAVVIGVLLLTGGGDSSSSTTASTAGEPSSSESGESKKITQAVLKPVGGGGAEGRAVLGRLGKQVVLEVIAKGLEPSAPGESYAIWLYHSPKLVLRVGAAKVDESGGLAVRLPIPAELLAYIAGGAFEQIYVSATPDAAYKAEVATAKAENRLPAYSGTTVLRGTITGPGIQTTASQPE